MWVGLIQLAEGLNREKKLTSSEQEEILPEDGFWIWIVCNIGPSLSLQSQILTSPYFFMYTHMLLVVCLENPK